MRKIRAKRVDSRTLMIDVEFDDLDTAFTLYDVMQAGEVDEMVNEYNHNNKKSQLLVADLIYDNDKKHMHCIMILIFESKFYCIMSRLTYPFKLAMLNRIWDVSVEGSAHSYCDLELSTM